MKKSLKRAAKGLIIMLFAGGLIFLTVKLVSFRMETRAPEVKESIDQIVDANKSELDKVKVDKSKISTAEDIYSIIHQMANTLIIAEDSMIFGEIPVNNDSISQAMVIVKDTDLIPKDEKEVFLNILQAWKEKDYSNSVQAHNYAWQKLNGNTGRAKELRPEYKKQI